MGLAVSLFGIQVVIGVYKLLGFTRSDSGAVIVRELCILALVGLVLWIVRAKEQLPLTSIGLKRGPIGATILWTLVVLIAFAATLFLCLGLILPALGLAYGSSGGLAPALPVTLLVVIRAGIAEEVFYRGFAIERIEALTGSKALAAGVPLVMFAAFHFSQGIAGVIVAFFIGAVATGFYMVKRNLGVLIAAHFLIDFIPNVLIPLLSKS
ncbi:MAG: Abi/CAAX domain protein [Novosphingobium sp.]|nr:Abi/CAAX domain protein [Novosphingobium sp.]